MEGFLITGETMNNTHLAPTLSVPPGNIRPTKTKTTGEKKGEEGRGRGERGRRGDERKRETEK